MTDEPSAPIPFDPDLEEKLRQAPQAVDAINARFARGSERMRRFEDELKRNTEATEATAQDLKVNTEMTREMWEVFSAAKSGIEALAKLGRGLAAIGRWLVKVVKVLAPLSAGLVAIYHAVGTFLGHPPTK